MTLALQCLVGLTVLVLGTTAALPALWLRREPQARPLPQSSEAGISALRVVRGAGLHWYLNGDPITAPALTRELAGLGQGGSVRFLPSAALPMDEVSRSLRWLRNQGTAPVLLELPEGR